MSIPYAGLVLLTALMRLVELRVARSNGRWAFAAGGVESGRGHYPVMVALHVGLLTGCLLEPWVAHRPFLPWLAGPMLAVLLGTHALRWWCIASLGRQWNTRVIVIPGLPLVTRGPYRRLRHPNYVAVVAEGIALPLVHTAWLTALSFTLLNLAVLVVRVRCEEAALAPLRKPGPAAARAAGPDRHE